MYRYSISATLASASASLDFTGKTPVLQRCAVQFSQKSASAANPKSLKVLSVYPSSFTVELSSTLPLDHPGKALRLYSRLLLEDQDFQAAVNSGRLLRTTELPPPRAASDIPCAEDEAFLHAIVEAIWAGDPRLMELKSQARKLGLLN